MIMTFDLIRETIFILDSEGNVLDGFLVEGITERDLPPESTYYTYKRLLVPENHCCLCGKGVDQLETSCVSNSSNHAIVGRDLSEVPAQHVANSYELTLYEVRFEEFLFYLEKDNLFPLLASQPTDSNSPLTV